MDDISVQIRLASRDDLADVQSCAQAAYGKYVERMNRVPAPMQADFALQIERAQVYAAFRQLTLTGYVVFYPQADHLHVESVAVHPCHTGQGIGRSLMQYVETTARRTGLKAIELYTNEAMTENLSLYPRLGYKETGRKQQAGFNRVFFRKTI